LTTWENGVVAESAEDELAGAPEAPTGEFDEPVGGWSLSETN
jgi:hypothetical protein